MSGFTAANLATTMIAARDVASTKSRSVDTAPMAV